MSPPLQTAVPREPESGDPARLLARGVCRALALRGETSLTEFTLRSGRRVDVMGLDRAGLMTIVEVKTSVADFRGDRKWAEYLDYCDRFYFAVPEGFPTEILPPDQGLMAADAFDAAILRDSAPLKLAPARRRAQQLRFALAAAERLARLTDPRDG